MTAVISRSPVVTLGKMVKTRLRYPASWSGILYSACKLSARVVNRKSGIKENQGKPLINKRQSWSGMIFQIIMIHLPISWKQIIFDCQICSNYPSHSLTCTLDVYSWRVLTSVSHATHSNISLPAPTYILNESDSSAELCFPFVLQYRIGPLTVLTPSCLRQWQGSCCCCSFSSAPLLSRCRGPKFATKKLL